MLVRELPRVLWERFCLSTGLVKIKPSIWSIKYDYRGGNPTATMFLKCPGPFPLKKDLDSARKKMARMFQKDIPNCEPDDTFEREMSRVA